MARKDTSKSVEAYLRIKDMVHRSRLTPGQKLIYRDLEESLGMSRTPVINGLIMLEKEGLVTNVRNRGFYVRKVTPKEAKDIYDIRERLELIAIEFAIERHESADLKELKKRIDIYNNNMESIYDKKRYSLDLDIHIQLAQMGKNNYFVAMATQFYSSIYFTLNVSALMPRLHVFKAEHDELFAAIRNRDLNLASEIIVRHIRASSELFVSAIQNSLGG